MSEEPSTEVAAQAKEPSSQGEGQPTAPSWVPEPTTAEAESSATDSASDESETSSAATSEVPVVPPPALEPDAASDPAPELDATPAQPAEEPATLGADPAPTVIADVPAAPEAVAEAAPEPLPVEPVSALPEPPPTPTVGHPLPPGAESWQPSIPASPDASGSGAERPELMVAAAFAGGFLFALILKRLGR